MAQNSDLIIIGGGPGGYNAAERAGEAGLAVTLLEKEKLGGVCLNWGCIPTKTLLATARHYRMTTRAKNFGVSAGPPILDWSQALVHKNQTVGTLIRGVKKKLKDSSVKVVKGRARLVDHQTVLSGGVEYRAPRILIATGSRPTLLSVPGLDSPGVVDSRDMLDIPRVPRSLVIVGAGVTGMEFASLFSTLGTDVTVVEYAPEILSSMDMDVARLLRKRLEERVKFILGVRILRVEGNTVYYSQVSSSGASDSGESVSAENILMAVGRKPVLDAFEGTGLDMFESGIVVDERMRTNLPGVWAAGDCTGLSMLAHSAYRMGEVAVADMLGGKQIMRYSGIPSVVYSLPEGAGTGMSEQEARDSGRSVITKKIPMQYSGRYLAENGMDEGFCKLIVDEDTRVLLGVHMVGDGCSEIIWGVSALIEAEFCVEDIRELVLPHPTISEILREGIWAL